MAFHISRVVLATGHFAASPLVAVPTLFPRKFILKIANVTVKVAAFVMRIVPYPEFIPAAAAGSCGA